MAWMESSKCSEVGSDLGFGQSMHANDQLELGNPRGLATKSVTPDNIHKFGNQLAKTFPNITMFIQNTFATQS